MKAILYKNYGPPNVVYLTDVDVPKPDNNELLIKVYATTVNRTDSGYRSAVYFVTRFWSGLFKPKFPILGCEFSGIVAQIGKDVATFKIGDKVFGYNDKEFGGHAEYVTIDHTKAVAIAPENISLYDCAAITEGAHYALNIIRAANIQKGQHVLVYGATGAIGSSAVQLLTYFEANVTAVCNTKNVELMKHLKVRNIIDYQKNDFTLIDQTYDFIFDAVGKSSFEKVKQLLNHNGVYISTELGEYGQNIFLAIKHFLLKKSKKVLFPIPPDLNQDDIIFLKELVELKLFIPVIDSYNKLEDIVSLYQYVESEQKTGNVIIKIID